MAAMPRVALFPTCVVDAVGAESGAAVVRVLRRLGYEVTVPRDTTCCGQPAWNAGFAAESATVARTTLEALDEAESDLICVPAGSCATMMKVFWPELFHVVHDEGSRRRAEALRSKLVEFSELVARHAGELPSAATRAVAYHHSCHMLRELGLKAEPEAVLDAVGRERVAWEGADERCCGFGGLFSVKQPETSVAMADDKIDALAATTADELVGCDASCLLHLRARMTRRGDHRPVRHLAEVVDEAMSESDR